MWGNYFFKSIQTIYCFPREFLSFIEINFDFHLVGRGSMRDYFRLRSTTFVNICFTPCTICFQHEWAKNVSNHYKTNNGHDFKFTKFSVSDFFLIDRRNLVRYASKNGLWQIFQLSIFALSREKRYWYQSHWRRNFRFFFSYFGFLHLLGNFKRLCPSKNF